MPNTLSAVFTFTRTSLMKKTSSGEVLASAYKFIKMVVDRLEEEGIQGNCFDII